MSFFNPEVPIAPVAQNSDDKTWGLLCHLSPLVAGFIGPLVIWLVKKDHSPFLEDQGKEALNFQISIMIYLGAAALSFIVCIGIVLLPAVAIFNVVMVIVAAIKANEGKPYRYPACIRLIS